MPAAEKRYTLFSDKSKPCAFFFSDKGCNNGDKCPWPHSKGVPVAAAAPPPPPAKSPAAAKKSEKAEKAP